MTARQPWECPAVNISRTTEVFGYDPFAYTAESHARVIYNCVTCGAEKETDIRYVVRSGGLCMPCSVNIKVAGDFQAQRKAEAAPNGLTHGENRAQRRAVCNAWKAQWRSTEAGRAIDRLRTSLRQARKGLSFKNLPYGVTELAEHIQERLTTRNYICALCGDSLQNGNYHIDHKIPLSTAKTEAEVIVLFALNNLDVLCPTCNMHVKRDRLMEY